MRLYETVIIAPPNLGEGDLEALVTGVETELTERFKGVNIQVDRWGKRALAYPIRKFNEGYYVLYRFESEEENCVSDLEGRLRINENIMRYLTIRKDEELKSEARMKARSMKRKKHEGSDDSDSDGDTAEFDTETE